MVLKKSKFNANTGNTLRRVCGCSTKGIARSMKTDAFVTKNLAPGFGYRYGRDDRWKNEIVHDALPNLANGVPYSLNKKKRWLLPDEIKNKCYENQYVDEPGRRRKSRRKKKIPEKKKCEVKIVTTGSSNWLQLTDRKPSKTWTGSLDLISEQDDALEVVYTVEKPSDSLSKFYSEANAKKFNYDYKENKNKSRYQLVNKTSRKRRLKDVWKNVSDDAKDCINENEDEENNNNYISREESEVVSRNHDKLKDSAESLQDDLKENAKKIKMFGINHLRENEDEFLELIEKLKEINYCRVEEIKRHNKKLRCYVETHKMQDTFLSKHFSQCFVEVQCAPRRFCIFDEAFFQTEKFLSVRVLSQAEKFTHVIIDFYNIPDFIGKYVDNLPEDSKICFEFLFDLCFNFDSLLSYYVTHVFKISNFIDRKKTKDLQCDILRLEQIWFDTLSHDQSEKNNADFIFQSSNCPICDSTSDITVLKTCGHSLCDDCWRKYIDAKLVSGCGTIACPDLQCDGYLDPAFVLTNTVDVDNAFSYSKRYSDTEVQKKNNLNFCPTADCGKVVRMKYHYSDKVEYEFDSKPKAENVANLELTNNNYLVECVCKCSWCFNCLEEYHWPATCKLYAKFKKQKVSAYDESGNRIKTYAAFKKCPYCKYPIERDGGCDAMICTCGGQFCWRCTSKIGDAVELHNCIDMRETTVLFNDLNSFKYLSKGNVAWTNKANFYSEYVEVIGRRLTHWNNVNIGKRSLLLLLRCYTLLRNFSIINAFRPSRHACLRGTLFTKKHSPDLERIYNTVAINGTLPTDENKNVNILSELLTEIVSFIRR